MINKILAPIVAIIVIIIICLLTITGIHVPLFLKILFGVTAFITVVMMFIYAFKNIYRDL